MSETPFAGKADLECRLLVLGGGHDSFADLEQHGDLVRVTVDGIVPLLADVTPLAVAELSLQLGLPVWSSVKATEIEVYPA